jgi:hypothetical protein
LQRDTSRERGSSSPSLRTVELSGIEPESERSSWETTTRRSRALLRCVSPGIVPSTGPTFPSLVRRAASSPSQGRTVLVSQPAFGLRPRHGVQACPGSDGQRRFLRRQHERRVGIRNLPAGFTRSRKVPSVARSPVQPPRRNQFSPNADKVAQREAVQRIAQGLPHENADVDSYLSRSIR